MKENMQRLGAAAKAAKHHTYDMSKAFERARERELKARRKAKALDRSRRNAAATPTKRQRRQKKEARNLRRGRTLSYRRAKIWERDHVKRTRPWSLSEIVDRTRQKDMDALEERINREEKS